MKYSVYERRSSGSLAVNSGNFLPTFRDNLSFPSTNWSHQQGTFEVGTNRFSRNIGKKLPLFNVHGSVHLKNIPIYILQDATLHSLFISGNCSTCFGWYFHPSPVAHTTVSTASGICHNVTAICLLFHDSGR